MSWQQFWETAQNWIMSTGVRIVIAIVILIVSFKLINGLARKFEKRAARAEEEKKLDKTLFRTISYITKIGLKVVVVLCLVGYLGIDTSGITTLIASLGVGVGLAVNGALANFAGGVLLIVTRPFRVDDYIEAGDYAGTVEDIHICTTKVRTPDNKVVYIPNGTLSTGTIVNYSEKDVRRVDLTVSIAYSADFTRAQLILQNLCEAHPLVLDDPAPVVRMAAHSASSIDITVRAWAKNADYWTVHFDLLEQVKAAFDEQKIEIPFQQLDVHLRQE